MMQEIWQNIQSCGVGISYNAETSQQSRFERVIKSFSRWIEMVAEKSSPTFAFILTILSIVIYICGFLRIEWEFNKEKNKIKKLESVVQSTKTSINSINLFIHVTPRSSWVLVKIMYNV